MMNNYTVFDVETANSKRDSICSIGIVRVENNEIVLKKEILVNPETDFDKRNINIHHITPLTVKNAGIFPQIWNEIRMYFDKEIVVAHNAKSMDICALFRTLERYNLPLIEIEYIDTLELAKNNLMGCENYCLPTICERLGVSIENHHNSLEDTLACQGILEYFLNNLSSAVIPKKYNYKPVSEADESCSCHSVKYSEKTKAMQELQNISEKIISDGIVTETEIRALFQWMTDNRTLQGYYPFDNIYELLENTLRDGIIDDAESLSVFDVLIDFIEPKISETNMSFNGKTICLSGEFNLGSKSDVEAILSEKGAIVVPSVTKKIDILILGEKGSFSWKYGKYGSKYEKVCKLNEGGSSILVYKESDMLRNLNSAEQDSCFDDLDEMSKVSFFFEPIKNLLCDSMLNGNGSFECVEGKNQYRINFVATDSIYRADNTNRVCIAVIRKDDRFSSLTFFEKNRNIFDENKVEYSFDEKDAFVRLSGKQYQRLIESESFVKLVENIVLCSYNNSSFGCCSKYLDCSKAGHCVHDDILFASAACQYKQNLDAGRIFYGEDVTE